MKKHSIILSLAVITLVSSAESFELRVKRQDVGPTPEECMKPPMTKHGHECCQLPREKIWGDLRRSFRMCIKKVKQEMKPETSGMKNEGPEMMTPPPVIMGMPTTMPNEPASTPFSGPGLHTGLRRKRPLSEKLKSVFSTFFNDIKNTFSGLWQTVVMITDLFRRHSNDSCFMECVFEDQGFLIDKVIKKEAVLDRFRETLGMNEPWHKATMKAFELCYMTDMIIPSNQTCQSGSEELFRCIFKQLFFNCPNWAQNSYCVSLREFYQKCPNGPPPEITDNHPTPTTQTPFSSSEEDDNVKTGPTTEMQTQ